MTTDHTPDPHSSTILPPALIPGTSPVRLLSPSLSSADTPRAFASLPPAPLRFASRRLDYLRALFFQYVIQDEADDAPFRAFIQKIETTLTSVTIEGRRKDLQKFVEERRSQYKDDFVRVLWGINKRLKEGKPIAKSDSEYLPLVQMIKNQDDYEGAVRRAAEEWADSLAASIANRDLTDEDLRHGRWQAAAQMKDDDELITAPAEEAVYLLGCHTRPHEWLTAWLVWEAKRYLEIEYAKALYDSDLVTYNDNCIWRMPYLKDMPPDEAVIRPVFFRSSESLEDQLEKLNQARRDLMAYHKHRKHPGPQSTPPPNDQLVAFCYRSLRRESYKNLARELDSSFSVHEKTLGNYIRRTFDLLFSNEPSGTN